jgi:glyoxylase-like metal-dependent hydrolase (beta-lactamase superfamily II)
MRTRRTAIDRRQLLAACGGTFAGLALPRRSWAAATEPRRVGRYRVTILSDGVRQMPTDFLWPDVPADELAAAFGQDSAPDVIDTPNNVTLIEGDGRVILVDAGSGPNFDPATGRLEDALDAMGIATDAVTDLVFTHGHPDHLWGALDDFEEFPRFAKARHLISEAEHAFWSGPMPTGAPPFLDAMARGAQRVLGDLEPTLELVPTCFEVAPGVTLRPTPGHTPGHVSVLVEDDGQSLLVIGDALTNQIVSLRHPDWPLATDVDQEAAAVTRKRLLERVAAEAVLIIGFHFPFPGIGRIARRNEGFAFASD